MNAAATLFAPGHVGNLGLLGLALRMTATGIGNLLPFQGRSSSRPSDGARLLGLLGGPFAAALRQSDANGPLPLASPPATLHAEYAELVRHQARELSPEQTARWLKAYRERDPLALQAEATGTLQAQGA